MSDDEHRCEICGLPDGAEYGDPHECPPGFLVDDELHGWLS